MTNPRHHLIFASDVRAGGGDIRELRTAVERGRLVRLRRGVYCERWRWNDADERQRHVLRVHAVMAGLGSEAIVCAESAAAMWGLPLAEGWAEAVSVLCPYRGGGKSEPGVRRTSVAPTDVHQIIDGLPVTTLSRTFIDLARSQPFAVALGTADAILARPDAPSPDRIADELRRMPLRTGRAAVTRVLTFASPASESVGESLARAAIIELGFEPPELQREFADDLGRMRVDFYWPTARVAGEFDGKVKYALSSSGGDPATVLVNEKRREDRLRRLVSGVVRMTAEDIREPHRLSRLLTDARIPRASDPVVASETHTRLGRRPRSSIYEG